MTGRSLRTASERWPIRGTFRIARGAKTEAEVVVVEIAAAGARGRGECVPYSRYGERVDTVLAQIESARSAIEAGASRESLLGLLPAGAARNAIDCALWDLDAKIACMPVHALAGLDAPTPVITARTLSIDAPAAMAEAAGALGAPLLKLKLAGDGNDAERIDAVRSASSAILWVDANEGLDEASYRALLPTLERAGVRALEQPFPAHADHALATLPRPVPVMADESAHDAASLDALLDRYDMVNLKLDKTGGLTGALVALDRAEALGLSIAIGCMVCTSLAIAPAMLLATRAELVDLDGALLLARDREGGATLDHDGRLGLVDGALWGGAVAR